MILRFAKNLKRFRVVYMLTVDIDIICDVLSFAGISTQERLFYNAPVSIGKYFFFKFLKKNS